MHSQLTKIWRRSSVFPTRLFDGFEVRPGCILVFGDTMIAGRTSLYWIRSKGSWLRKCLKSLADDNCLMCFLDQGHRLRIALPEGPERRPRQVGLCCRLWSLLEVSEKVVDKAHDAVILDWGSCHVLLSKARDLENSIDVALRR